MKGTFEKGLLDTFDTDNDTFTLEQTCDGETHYNNFKMNIDEKKVRWVDLLGEYVCAKFIDDKLVEIYVDTREDK